MGGAFVQEVNSLKNELNDYGKRKLSSIQISYNADLDQYQVAFGCLYQKRTFYPTFYMTYELVGENQVKFHYTGEGNDASAVYAEKCPSFISYMNSMSTTFTLVTSSLLAPVDMKLVDGSNYTYWIL